MLHEQHHLQDIMCPILYFKRWSLFYFCGIWTFIFHFLCVIRSVSEWIGQMYVCFWSEYPLRKNLWSLLCIKTGSIALNWPRDEKSMYEIPIRQFIDEYHSPVLYFIFTRVFFDIHVIYSGMIGIFFSLHIGTFEVLRRILLHYTME